MTAVFQTMAILSAPQNSNVLGLVFLVSLSLIFLWASKNIHKTDEKREKR